MRPEMRSGKTGSTSSDTPSSCTSQLACPIQVMRAGWPGAGARASSAASGWTRGTSALAGLLRRRPVSLSSTAQRNTSEPRFGPEPSRLRQRMGASTDAGDHPRPYACFNFLLSMHPTKTKTKTNNENENPKTKTVLVARSRCSFSLLVLVGQPRATPSAWHCGCSCSRWSFVVARCARAGFGSSSVRHRRPPLPLLKEDDDDELDDSSTPEPDRLPGRSRTGGHYSRGEDCGCEAPRSGAARCYRRVSQHRGSWWAPPRERQTRTSNENENGFRLRFSFWFFVFVDGFRFGSRWPLLADEPAEQGIDPTGAGCPCGRSVSGAAARDGSDIERGRGLADLTAGDRVDALLICAPRPAGSLRDVQASAAGSIESLRTH